MSAEGTVSPPYGELDDGFGNTWGRCELADKCVLQVVRPGKVQCECDGMDMPRTETMVLADNMHVDFGAVCFIVRQAERLASERSGSATEC